MIMGDKRGQGINSYGIDLVPPGIFRFQHWRIIFVIPDTLAGACFLKAGKVRISIPILNTCACTCLALVVMAFAGTISEHNIYFSIKHLTYYFYVMSSNTRWVNIAVIN